MKSILDPRFLFAVVAAVLFIAAQALGLDAAGFVAEHREAIAGIALMGTVSLPNGGTFAIASAYGSNITVTAITNANPAVATATAHGLSNGDIIEVTSGWAKLNNRIVRVANVTANTFELEGINTTSTISYPAGAGTGTVRAATTFVQLAQILNTNTSGGEQNFAAYQFLESDESSEIPTNKSPRRLTLSLADDPTLPGYIEAAEANEDRLVRAVRFSLPSGSKIYYNGFVTVNETPSTTTNEIMAVEMTLAIQGRATRYAT